MIWSCRAALVLALLSVSCNREPSARPERAPEGGESKDEPCTRLPFAEMLPVAEASGAALLTVDGRAVLLVAGDSGTAGAYLLVDAATGETVESGQLPLGSGAGDDVEGLAADGDTVWGVTSAGWMRRWHRVAGGFALDDGPYPVGEVDETLPATPPMGGLGAEPTDALACAAHGVNCGKNYEALCVVPRALARDDGACAGWLGAKADGRLWCLVDDGGRLVADRARSIAVTGAHVLAGCDLDPASGALWLGTNGFDGTVYRVDGWRDPATATVRPVHAFSEGFLEALAVVPGPEGLAVVRFSDVTRAPSPVDRWRCR